MRVTCLLLCFLFQVGVTSSRKPYTLRVLNLVPSDGEDLKGAELSVEVTKLLAEIVNNRSDILPLYHVEVIFKGESDGPATIVEFSEQATTAGVYLSPIVNGPEYSTNCKAVAPLAPYLNLVIASSFCTAPVLSDHRKFRNLYLPMSTGQFNALTIVYFLKEVGKWNRFALLTNAGNVNDYGTAIIIQKEAEKQGLVMPYFSMLVDIDEDVMKNLKNSDLRIIVFYSGVDSLVFKFLCMAYEFGITGPRYVFVASFDTFSKPSSLGEIPDGCNSTDILAKQFQQVYWIGPAMSVDELTTLTLLGMSQKQFDRMIDNYAGRTQEDSGEYLYRYVYHDAALTTLLALHTAEEILQTQNLSLRDGGQVAMEAANTSLSHLKTAGLRIGRIGYNKRANFDRDVQVIAHYSPSTNIENLVTYFQNSSNGSELDYSSYVGVSGRPINWGTKDNRPPLDERRYLRRIRSAEADGFVAISVVSFLLVFLNLSGVAYLTHLSTRGLLKHDIPRSKIICLSGCALMAVGSAIFTRSSRLALSFGIGLVVAGLAGVVTVLATRLAVIMVDSDSYRRKIIRAVQRNKRHSLQCGNARAREARIRNCNKQIFQGRSTNRRSLVIPTTLPIKTWLFYENVIVTTVSFVVIAKAIVVAVWFSTAPPGCSLQMTNSNYNFDLDTLVQTAIVACLSGNSVNWALSLAGVDVFVLLIGLFYAYKMQHDGHHFLPKFQYLYATFGLANALTIYLVTPLILVMLGNAVDQQLAIAVAVDILSSITSLTMLLPHI